MTNLTFLVAGICLTLVLSHCFLLYGLTEFYYSKFLTHNLNTGHNYFFEFKPISNFIQNNCTKLIYCFVIHTLSVFSWKTSIAMTSTQFLFLHNFFFFFSMLFLWFLIFLRHQVFTNQNFILLIIFLIVIYFFYFVFNLLTLVLVLEIVATIYYFFFLNISTKTLISIYKLKNLIINYIWISLLTLIVFSYAIIILIYEIGTVEFYEISLFKTLYSNLFIIVFLTSIFWKISLPGYHFFKYEIYKMLPLHTIIYFSIFSISINFLILIFLSLNFFSFNFLIKNLFFFLILSSNVILVGQGVSNLKFFQFIALSGFNTLTTIFLFIFL